MKLRTKTIIAVSLVSLLIFGVMQIVTVLVIQPSFINLENQETKDSITQATSTISYRLSQLTGKVKDYSFWDDTYNFVQNYNQDYVENNYVDDTFVNLNLNLIAIVNNTRSLVYCQSFDLNNSAKVQTSEETRSVLTSDEFIWTFSSTENTISGIMLVDNQPMLVATAPILTSLSQGPIMGGMLLGKYVDYQEIRQLQKIMNVNFALYTISDFRVQKVDTQIVESLLLNGQIVVKENNPDSVSGYTLIKDIHSNPIFILQTTQNRTAYQQGIAVGNIFAVATIILSFCFGALILFLLEREIVKPMIKLAAYVEEIALNPNTSGPKTLSHSSEELDVLTNSVRNTLKRKLEGMYEASRMVGHDLRNPLTGIKGATYLLKKNHVSKMDEKGNALLKTIDDCVEYSDKIVRDLLEYSCEIKLDKVKTNPERLVNDSLSTLAVPSNIQVVNDASDDFSLLVDHGKIERVFCNLVKNAFDSMLEGGNLKITSRKVNGQVEIDFSDSGVGMPKEVLEKLWTPFFTTKAKGLGVGLSICKRIIDAHGGRIEVKSILGKGTVFAVFLPSDGAT
jgi:signal transduction histidine kinase